MSELSTKIVKLDLDFILNHYLNRALWKKKWTIFKFGDYTIQVRLYSIDMYVEKVWLRLSILSKTGREIDWELLGLNYDEEHRNLKVLNQTLSGKVVSLIESAERSKIFQTEEYDRALEAENTAKEAIKEAAERLLDNLNITNEDIREAYINRQKANASFDYRYNVVNALKYKILTPFYLTYLRFAEYESRYQAILDDINKPDYDPTELDEFIESMETGEFSESLQLEEI